MTDVSVPNGRGQEYPVVNPLDLPTDRYDKKSLFLMWAGSGCTPVQGYVWADHFEDAFEEWVEYLDDHAPGVLVSEDEFKELLDEAAQEKGFDTWADAESSWVAKNGKAAGWHNEMLDDYSDIVESAEADLTVIGHTSLKHGRYIASYDWGGDEIEVSNDLNYDRVWNACADAYHAQYDEWPEPPPGVKQRGGKGTKITDLDGVSDRQRASQQLPRWARPPRR